MNTTRFLSRRPIWQSGFRWFLAVILGIHAFIALNQSFLAGAYLSGSMDAMKWHGLLGSILTVIVMAQAAAALLFWLLGRGPWWPFVISIPQFMVEGMQIGFGYARQLEMHVPMGVMIILGTWFMFVWSLRWKPRSRAGVKK